MLFLGEALQCCRHFWSVIEVRELVVGGEQWRRRLREAAARHQPLMSKEQEAAFSDALALGHKVLNDREQPHRPPPPMKREQGRCESLVVRE